jgi:hypothetical protein
VISKAVATMEPGRVLMGTKQRLASSRIDRDFGPAEFNGIERVAGGLLYFDISRDRCDRYHADVGGAESHDQSHGVIRGNVGVDQEGARHPRRITKSDTGKVISACDCVTLISLRLRMAAPTTRMAVQSARATDFAGLFDSRLPHEPFHRGRTPIPQP